MRRYFSASWLVLADYVLGQCPNSCSNKGQCDKFGVCHCLNGYGGGDCSLRTCPSDYAWTDYATADDVAHAKAECSNRGLCDRTSGRCECMVGFTGRACERMSCDFNCYNKGKCLSMRKIALTQYSDESEKFVYEAPWDADKVFGCVCDRPYDRFFNCAQRTCPSGDDPFTTGQVNEVQILKCMATGGSFALMYEGKSSGTIRARMTEEEVEKALTEAETIHAAKVTFTADNGTVCQSDSTNLVKIEFTQNFGSLPPLKPKADTLAGTVLVYADGLSQVGDADGTNHISIKGTKEDDQCSNRGLCDTFTATCACMTTNNDVYSSSDGYGNKGTRGDCGHAENSVTTCPGELPCSSNGVCDEETYRCSCKEGWYGADCSLRQCPLGLSWTSYPSADNVAHDEIVECSDGGSCDMTTGLCTCSDQFFGAACEYMACPTGNTVRACSGNGRCMSMYELSKAATSWNGDEAYITYGTDVNNPMTWDAHRVFGCHCDDGWTGYDCSLRRCPTGDDPGTHGQVNELQLFRCSGDSGTFRLKFRRTETTDIPHNASATEIEAALENLSTITDVDVAFTNGNSVCSVGSSTTTSIQFVTEHGDLPPITADTSNLHDSSTGANGLLEIFTDGEGSGMETSMKGTTEDAECSNRGICDRGTGVCQCFDGYSSSDGRGNKGRQGDCGHRELCNAGWCNL